MDTFSATRLIMRDGVSSIHTTLELQDCAQIWLIKQPTCSEYENTRSNFFFLKKTNQLKFNT